MHAFRVYTMRLLVDASKALMARRRHLVVHLKGPCDAPGLLVDILDLDQAPSGKKRAKPRPQHYVHRPLFNALCKRFPIAQFDAPPHQVERSAPEGDDPHETSE